MATPESSDARSVGHQESQPGTTKQHTTRPNSSTHGGKEGEENGGTALADCALCGDAAEEQEQRRGCLQRDIVKCAEQRQMRAA